MKSHFLKLIACVLLSLAFLSIQAAEPIIEVLPSKRWCVKYGFANKEVKQGKTKYTEDFQRAFAENDEIGHVCAAIGEVFNERFDFPLKNAQTSLDDLEDEEIEDEFMESEEGGAGIQKNSWDMLMNKDKPDIALLVEWTDDGTHTGDYKLQAVDAYSKKDVAVITGSYAGSINRSLASILKEALVSNLDAFVGQIKNYFNVIQTEGREISLAVHVWDNAGFSLTSEFGGVELGDIITKWLDDNSIGHKYTRVNSTPNTVRYAQIRIPLRNDYGGEFGAHEFVQKLRDHLKNYGVASANRTKALGTGVIALGSK